MPEPMTALLRSRVPWSLVNTEVYDRLTDGFARERQIKGWSRAKKEALMRMDYEALPGLSRNRQTSARGPRGSTGLTMRTDSQMLVASWWPGFKR